MFEIKYKVRVDHQNFTEVMSLFIAGYKSSNYNRECFSTKEVTRFMICDLSIDLMIQEIIAGGYCPQKLLEPIEKKCQLDLGIIPHSHLKQEIDENFNILINGSVVELGKAYLGAV